MEFVGRNSIVNLRNIAQNKVLLFTQEGIYKIFGNIVDNELQNKDVTFFTKITENPKREEIQQAQDLLKDQTFDCIVAFGGGSVIDFAKAFRFYDKRNVPLIARVVSCNTVYMAIPVIIKPICDTEEHARVLLKFTENNARNAPVNMVAIPRNKRESPQTSL